MKLKTLNYLLSPLVSLLLLSGCGSSSSSEEQVQAEEEQVAIYIPSDKLQEQKELSKATTYTPSSKLSTLIKENAERDNIDAKWFMYDKNPAGGSVDIKYDDLKKSRVIEFNSHGLLNGFALGAWTKYGAWSNKTHKIVQWSMSYAEDYYIYIRISTKKGYRYLYYTSEDYNYGMVSYDSPHYIHHGLGTSSTDGSWKTFTRDIEADLKEFDPTNTLLSIDGFFVRGSGRIDDVALLSNSDDTTPPDVIPTIDEAIDRWLTSQSLIKNSSTTAIISSDKTRAVIKAHQQDGPNTDTTYILDISDLNNIKKLTERWWYRYTYPIEIKIKEGDYILLARSTEFVLYDYNTGELLSPPVSVNAPSPVVTNMHYLLIEDDYAIVTRSNIHNNQALFKIDFTDRSRPIVTKLYDPEDQDRPVYQISDDKTKVIVKDENDNMIKEIYLINTPSNIKSAINLWLKNNTSWDDDRPYPQTVGKIITNTEGTRAVTSRDLGWRNAVVTIFDISNLNDIKALANVGIDDHYDFLEGASFKANEYIVVATSFAVTIFDHTTGDRLSVTGVKGADALAYPAGVNYINITPTYTTYKYIGKNDNELKKKLNYSDPRNPIIENL